MRGRWRARKKLVKRAGWTVEREVRSAGEYRLELRSPGGQPVEVVADSRPSAWRKAAARVAPRPG